MNKVTYLNEQKDIYIDEYGQLHGSWDDRGFTTSTRVPDLRGRHCYICGQEWALRGRAYLDHVLLHGEDVHRTCYARLKTLMEWECWKEHLAAANIPNVSSQRVVNPYGTNADGYPDRFLFDLDHVWCLKLHVGSRKRVDEIKFLGMPYELFHKVREHFDNAWEPTNGYRMDSSAEGPYVYLHTNNTKEIAEALAMWRAIVVAQEQQTEFQLSETQLKDRDGSTRWRTFTQIDAHLAERAVKQAELAAERASEAAKRKAAGYPATQAV